MSLGNFHLNNDRNQYTPIRMVNSITQLVAGEAVEQKSHSLLLGMWNDAANSKDCLAVSYKSKQSYKSKHIHTVLKLPFFVFTQMNYKCMSTKQTGTQIFIISFIHNFQNLEAT